MRAIYIKGKGNWKGFAERAGIHTFKISQKSKYKGWLESGVWLKIVERKVMVFHPVETGEGRVTATLYKAIPLVESVKKGLWLGPRILLP